MTRDSGQRQDRDAPDDGRTRPALADQRGVATVYGAAEDSRLLADAAVERIDGGLVCEVGVGSGYVARRIAAETGADVVGTDVAAPACERASDAGVSVVRGNLADPFRADLFDAVVFNPPYLPTPPDREWGDPLAAALSGGPDGRAVIDPFLGSVGRVLAPDGLVLLVASSLTGLDAIRQRAAEAGLSVDVVAGESHPFERLVVLAMRHSVRAGSQKE
ncbi:MAG: HemK2/MTQ2 family protein methyltransferase [Salinirussus sp.]